MCDCYSTACVACGAEIQVHVGDFSVSREHVHPFCYRPECHQYAMEVLEGRRYPGEKRLRKLPVGQTFIVFSEAMYGPTEGYRPCEGAKTGDVFLFLVDYPRQVHTN